MAATAPHPPELLWAQRSSETDESKNVIYLTVNVPELQPGYSLSFPTPSTLSFTGSSGGSANAGAQSQAAHTASSVPSRQWKIEGLQLFGEVEEKETKEKLTGKSLQVVLRKKELTEDYWPRLTKDKRVNFVKTDFTRWVDQDEQEGVAVDEAFGGGGADMGMGGMGGMPGMGGMGGMGGGGPGGFDMASMMQSMGGGGPGGMDMEALMKQMKESGAGLGGEDDDDEMPELAKEGGEEDEDLPPLEDA